MKKINDEWNRLWFRPGGINMKVDELNELIQLDRNEKHEFKAFRVQIEGCESSKYTNKDGSINVAKFFEYCLPFSLYWGDDDDYHGSN